MDDLPSIQALSSELRRNVQTARTTATRTAAELGAAEQRLRQVRLKGSVASTESVAAFAEVERLRLDQRAAVANRELITAEMANALRERFRNLEHESVLAGLDRTVPVVLLPVRLETRFSPTPEPTELLVRIFPDDIHVDTHEDELTPDEIDLGRRFWNATWWAGTDETGFLARQAAWADLARPLGPTRAAWVARSLKPESGTPPTAPVPEDQRPTQELAFPNPPQRAATTRPPWTDALPDRWVVLGYRGRERVALAWSDVVPEPLVLGPNPEREVNPLQTAGDDQPDLDESVRWVTTEGFPERRRAAEWTNLGGECRFDGPHLLPATNARRL